MLLRPNTKSSLIKSTRSMPYILGENSDPANPSNQLKKLFFNFIESSNTFLDNNSNLLFFRNEFSNMLNETSRTFLAFHNVVSRICGSVPSLVHGKKPGLVSGANAIHISAIPFLKDWKTLSELVIKIESLLSNVLADHIQKMFSEVNDLLEDAPEIDISEEIDQMYQGYCFMYRNLKQRNNLLFEAKNMIKKIHRKITGEKNCEKVMKILTSIKRDIEKSISFEGDAHNLFSSFERFQELLRFFIERLELQTTLLELNHNEDSAQPELVIRDTAKLFEVIEAGKTFFRGEASYNLLVFFDRLSKAAEAFRNEMMNEIESARKSSSNLIEQLNSQLDEQQNEIYRLTQANKELRQQNLDLIKKVERIRGIIPSQENDSNSSSHQNNDSRSNLTTIHINANADSVYMKCVEHVIGLPVGTVDPANVEAMFMKHLQAKKPSECEVCKKMLKREEAIVENLKHISDEATDAVEASRIVVTRFSKADTLMQELKNQNDGLNQMNQKYLNCIKEILALFTPVENEELDLVSYAIKCTKENITLLKKQIQDALEQKEVSIRVIIEKINSITGIPATTFDESLQNLVTRHENSQSFLKEVEFRLCRILNIPPSVYITNESIRRALDRVDSLFETVSNPQLQDKYIPEIFEKLRVILGDKEKYPRHEYVNRIAIMLDKLDVQLNELKKGNRSFQSEQMQQKSSMEMIHSKLSKFMSIPPSDGVGKLECIQILHSITSLLDGLLRSQMSGEFFSKSEIDDFFKEIIETEPVSSKTEPRLYIPEVCYTFRVMRDSINSLNPFVEILDTLFKEFDSKFASFDLSSENFSIVKSNVKRLQDQLNVLEPNSINSTVFHALSRFVALTCSYTAALTTLPSDAGEQTH